MHAESLLHFGEYSDNNETQTPVNLAEESAPATPRTPTRNPDRGTRLNRNITVNEL